MNNSTVFPDIRNFIARYVTQRQENLFARDMSENKKKLASAIQGKSALVIGGAGNIGSSFINELLKFSPARLVVVDSCEYNLARLSRDLRNGFCLYTPEYYKGYPINYHDPLFDQILKNDGPFDIVANFAAHSPEMDEKDVISIHTLLENNVIMAEKLMEKLIWQAPSHFFFVSTDMAINPVNITGASKKIMEEIMLGYSRFYPVTTARFSKVDFSDESLLYGFLQRIMKSQPLLAPSKVKQYLITLCEAGQMCLLACILGENGDKCFPKPEAYEMQSLAEIADKFLHFLGYKPVYCNSENEAREYADSMDPESCDYPVYFSEPDKPRKKPYEEFYAENEKVDWQRFHNLAAIKNAPRKALHLIRQMTSLLEFSLNSEELSKVEIVAILKNFLPELKRARL
jgi:FlaA1/EpsC-like NDP-sugar epimerase